MHYSQLMMMVGLGLILLTTCTIRTSPEPTPGPTGEVSGILRPWSNGTPVEGRHVVMCRSVREMKAGECVLRTQSTTTDNGGKFHVEDVPIGTYFLMYDSGLSDFYSALEKWGGKTLYFGNRQWLSEFLGIDLDEEWVAFRLPEGISPSPHESWLSVYCGQTLLLGNSPFIIAHDMELAHADRTLRCLKVDVIQSQTTQVEAHVVYFGE